MVTRLLFLLSRVCVAGAYVFREDGKAMLGFIAMFIFILAFVTAEYICGVMI